jgi:hypothetical protein
MTYSATPAPTTTAKTARGRIEAVAAGVLVLAICAIVGLSTTGNIKAKADAAAKEAVHLVSEDHPWRALQKNWWMPFIDGWAHECGVTVYDHHTVITDRGGDGQLSAHLQTQYDKFSKYDLMYHAHLSIDMVEIMNMNLQGVSWAANPNFGNWEGASPYTEWFPRHPACGGFEAFRGCGGEKPPIIWTTPLGEKPMMGYTGAVHVDKAKIFREAKATRDYSANRGLYRTVRVGLIGDPLDHFYAAITKPDCNVTSFTDSLADHSHPRAALGCLLPAAATLYATMAQLHPFIDGNSRTRTTCMVLNTQLTRAGAHPVVLYNNGWAAYHMNSLEELEEYLLGGYCAWEYVLATGESPYVGHAPDIDCAHPPADDKTNKRAGGANRSPVPLYDREKDVCLVPQGLRSRA